MRLVRASIRPRFSRTDKPEPSSNSLVRADAGNSSRGGRGGERGGEEGKGGEGGRGRRGGGGGEGKRRAEGGRGRRREGGRADGEAARRQDEEGEEGGVGGGGGRGEERGGGGQVPGLRTSVARFGRNRGALGHDPDRERHRGATNSTPPVAMSTRIAGSLDPELPPRLRPRCPRTKYMVEDHPQVVVRRDDRRHHADHEQHVRVPALVGERGLLATDAKTSSLAMNPPVSGMPACASMNKTSRPPSTGGGTPARGSR